MELRRVIESLTQIGMQVRRQNAYTIDAPYTIVSTYTKGKIPMAGGESSTPVTLSDREVQIIELVAAGLTNQEIAQQLEISKRTVDNHISNILTKTSTDNRVALVRWALQWGKVCLNDVNCCPLPMPKHDAFS